MKTAKEIDFEQFKKIVSMQENRKFVVRIGDKSEGGEKIISPKDFVIEIVHDLFHKADADNDNFISKDEFKIAEETLFVESDIDEDDMMKFDADGNGKFDAREFAALAVVDAAKKANWP